MISSRKQGTRNVRTRSRTRNFEMLWTRTRTRIVRTRTRYFKSLWTRTRDQGTRTLKHGKVHNTGNSE